MIIKILFVIAFALPKIHASYADIVNYAEVIMMINANGYDDVDDDNTDDNDYDNVLSDNMRAYLFVATPDGRELLLDARKFPLQVGDTLA